MISNHGSINMLFFTQMGGVCVYKQVKKRDSKEKWKLIKPSALGHGRVPIRVSRRYKTKTISDYTSQCSFYKILVC